MQPEPPEDLPPEAGSGRSLDEFTDQASPPEYVLPARPDTRQPAGANVGAAERPRPGPLRGDDRPEGARAMPSGLDEPRPRPSGDRAAARERRRQQLRRRRLIALAVVVALVVLLVVLVVRACGGSDTGAAIVIVGMVVDRDRLVRLGRP